MAQKRTVLYGSRRGSRSGAMPEQPHSSSSSPTSTAGEAGAGQKGGTPDDVRPMSNADGVRRVVRKVAFALLVLEQLLVEDQAALEDWGDNVKPAVDLLFRFSGEWP